MHWHPCHRGALTLYPLAPPYRAHDAGWSSPVARQAHNLKVTGSNPVPATIDTNRARPKGRALLLLPRRDGENAPKLTDSALPRTGRRPHIPTPCRRVFSLRGVGDHLHRLQRGLRRENKSIDVAL